MNLRNRIDALEQAVAKQADAQQMPEWARERIERKRKGMESFDYQKFWELHNERTRKNRRT